MDLCPDVSESVGFGQYVSGGSLAGGSMSMRAESHCRFSDKCVRGSPHHSRSLDL